MELTLTYKPDHHDTPAAVFLRGSDTRWWLEHFRVWGLLPEDVTLLPLSAADGASVAGLFVIFKEDKTPTVSLLPEPFVLTGNKMFIPHGATLQPAMTVAELNTLCIWKYQLLHPSLGFFGLEEEDVLPAESLVLIPAPVVEEWSNLIQDVSQLPILTSIRVEMPEEDAFMQEVKNVGDKALRELPAPKGQPTTLLGKLWRFILYWLLRLVKGLLSLFVVSGPVNSGFMGRLMDRINTKLSTMGSWFESDEERLLRLFKENPELALQFAPPLDPNARPGEGSSSAGNWMQRNTRFNSSLLDWAGSSGGAWVIADNSYAELQNQYRKAAAQAEQEGDWSRAAYIYAHLLKEYHAAATALRKGKFYADAANIYLKQLDSLHKAAECYEEGGMYPEAIALYLKMELYEKAGDLHVLNGDAKAAAECFEKTVAYDLKYNNYLSAAKTIRNKLHDTPRARRCLLDGWYSGEKMEDCMQQYIQLGEEPKDATIRWVYEEVLTTEGRAAFLSVMNKLKDEYPEVKDTVRDLAYRLIGDSVRDGEKHLLPMLANLVPGDPFLRSDAALFQNYMPVQPVKKKATASMIKLKGDVAWLDAYSWRQQIIAFGRRGNQLMLARCNWDGAVQYREIAYDVQAYDFGSRWDYVVSISDFDSRIVICDGSSAGMTTDIPFDSQFGDGFSIKQDLSAEGSKYLRAGRYETKVILVADVADSFAVYKSLPDAEHMNVVFISESIELLKLTGPLFYWNGKYFVPDEGRMLVIFDEEAAPRIIEGDFGKAIQHQRWIAWLNVDSLIVMNAEDELEAVFPVDDDFVMTDLKFLTPALLALVGSSRIIFFSCSKGVWSKLSEMDAGEHVFKLLPSGAPGRFAMMEYDGQITFHDLPEEAS